MSATSLSPSPGDGGAGSTDGAGLLSAGSGCTRVSGMVTDPSLALSLRAAICYVRIVLHFGCLFQPDRSSIAARIPHPSKIGLVRGRTRGNRPGIRRRGLLRAGVHRRDVCGSRIGRNRLPTRIAFTGGSHRRLLEDSSLTRGGPPATANVTGSRPLRRDCVTGSAGGGSVLGWRG